MIRILAYRIVAGHQCGNEVRTGSVPLDCLTYCFFRNGDEGAYVRRLYALSWRYCKKKIEVEGFDLLSICRLRQPYDRSYVVRDVAEWWRELGFERRDRMNAKGWRFADWYSL